MNISLLVASRRDVVVEPEDVARSVAALERGKPLAGARAVDGRPALPGRGLQLP